MQTVRSTREEPELEREAIEQAPLLLHSIGQFGEVSRRPLDIVAPRRIVEIGAEGAGFTVTMAEWVQQNGAELISVDPAPSAKLRDLAKANSRVTLIEEASPGALAQIKPADLYVVDGDHNYHVVHSELEAILAATADRHKPVLCILHDVGWPCARRDFYYSPEAIGPAAVHPHSYGKGLVKDDSTLQEGRGHRGMGSMAIAEESGGARNGVLTAVEDAIAARQGLELHIIPAIFGLGFLFPSDAPWAGELRSFLTPLASSELVANLEHSRLALYLTLLEMQDELTRRTARYNRHLNNLEDQIAGLASENLAKRGNSGAKLRVDSDSEERTG